MLIIIFYFFIKNLVNNGPLSSFIYIGRKPTAEVTLLVLDADNGKPVPDMPVGMSTFVRWQPGPNFGKDIHKQVNGKTDKYGKVILSVPSIRGEVTVGIHRQEGYYYTKGEEYKFKKKKSGYWQPRNPTITLITQMMGKQVPMYARGIGWYGDLIIPEVNTSIGLDLIEADWIAPYGKGKVADFIFKVERNFKSRKEYDNKLTLSFSNEGDGIQSVYAEPYVNQLRLPRQAPEEGYEQLLVQRDLRIPGKSYDIERNDQNYFFRIRTLKKDGKIISAMYGKIHGKIGFDCINSKESALILFTYYLNPDGTRNMEFDLNKNLFTNLKSTEAPNEP
jgi:hypothetical protein